MDKIADIFQKKRCFPLKNHLLENGECRHKESPYDSLKDLLSSLEQKGKYHLRLFRSNLGNLLWYVCYLPTYLVHTVFPQIVSAETILF